MDGKFWLIKHCDVSREWVDTTSIIDDGSMIIAVINSDFDFSILEPYIKEINHIKSSNIYQVVLEDSNK